MRLPSSYRNCRQPERIRYQIESKNEFKQFADPASFRNTRRLRCPGIDSRDSGREALLCLPTLEFQA